MSSIALEDYLSEDKKQEIAEEAFRDICREKFLRDDERIFSNAAYHAVWAVVDEAFDGKAAEMVAEKIPSVIESLGGYSVFRAGNVYGDKESPGMTALRKAVEQHKDLLSDRIAQLSGEITKEQVIELLLDSDLTLKISAQ